MVAQSSSRARQRATRRMVCSFAKHRSIGFRSGLYFGRKQSVAHRRTPMHRQIVQHDDVAGAQRRCEHVFDVGEEAHAIDRTVKDGGGREAGHAQCGEQGRRVPAPVGGVVDHALAPLPNARSGEPDRSARHLSSRNTSRAGSQVGAVYCHAARASAIVQPGVFGRVHRFFSGGSRTSEARRRRQRLLPLHQRPIRLLPGSGSRAAATARAGAASATASGGAARSHPSRAAAASGGRPTPRLTAYFSATSFDAMPASLSLSYPRP